MQDEVKIKVTKDELYYGQNRYVKGDVIKVPRFWAEMIVKQLKAGEFVEPQYSTKILDEGGNE